MGRPKGNGLVELIDDNTDRGRRFFCMDLVMHMWNDEAVRGGTSGTTGLYGQKPENAPTATVASDTGGRWRNRADGPYS